MTIWLINIFWDLPQEGNREQRYWLMAREFANAGHNVIYWTSDFSHATKKLRVLHNITIQENSFAKEFTSQNITVKLLRTKPYKKNISLKRIISHISIARTFKRAIKNENKPDLIIACTPPLTLCARALNTAKKFKVPFVCDIQDAWPQTFERVVPRFLLYPLQLLANKIYRTADGIIAVSQAYLELAEKSRARAKKLLVPQIIEMDEETKEKEISPNFLRLAYCGNMSLSYDLETLIQAVKECKSLTLTLAGDGPNRPRLEELANDCARISFLGYLEKDALRQMLQNSDVGIIPIFPNSLVGIPGKLADYASANLFIVESLGNECGEIVSRFKVGAHYEAGNRASLINALKEIKTMPRGDHNGLRNLFDAKLVLPKLLSFVDELQPILHIANGWTHTNGIAVMARLIASKQKNPMFRRFASYKEISHAKEIWLHGAWMPCLYLATLFAKLSKKKIVRMPHGSYLKTSLMFHPSRKRLFKIFEKWTLQSASKIIATSKEEASDIRAYLGADDSRIEIIDAKQFFEFPLSFKPRHDKQILRVLYLGREHPLKGLDELRAAVNSPIVLRVETNLNGKEKEDAFEWCDVVALPTLSENFGLVIAEALSRGKRAITTDGASAWEDDARVVYLNGYCKAPFDLRVKMLHDAFIALLNEN